MPTYLYHYSPASSGELTTLTTELKRNPKLELKDSPFKWGPYESSIAFFVDPINPVAILDEFQGDGRRHPVWWDGNQLIQHVVDASSLVATPWMIVESPISQMWRADPEFDKMSDAEWQEWWWEALKKHNLRGVGVTGLIKAIKPYQTHTMDYFKSQPRDNNNRWTQYATCVPHVMVYPPKGEIPIVASTPFTVGRKS